MAKEREKDGKTNAMRILDKASIPYTVMTYTCEQFIDGVHVAEQLGIPPEASFKTLVTVGKSKNHFVFVLPVDQELDLKKAARAVGEKSVEMIPVKNIFEVTGYIRGGCSPLGMKKQFFTVIDETAQLFDEIYISGGRIGAQIKLRPEELCRIIGGKFEDILL